MADFDFRWNGAALEMAMRSGLASGAEKTRSAVESHLKATLHRVSGQMADESYAVLLTTDNETVLLFGSDAPHTAAHELGWHRLGPNGEISFEGHPQIREIGDTFGPKFAADVSNGIRAATRGS